jgi:prophage maintenance system killer protein
MNPRTATRGWVTPRSKLMLMPNGFELSANVDNSEAEVLAVAVGSHTREQFQNWLERHVVPYDRARG